MAGGSRWLAAVVVALAVAGALIVLREPPLAQRTADFNIGFSAALLVRSGHPEGVYDQSQLGPMLTRVTGGVIDPRLPYTQPLAAAGPFLLLTFLPVEAALRVWQLISVAILFVALLVLQRAFALGRRAALTGLLALLASAPAWATLLEGQTTPLLVLGAAFLVRSTGEDRPLDAAVGGALLAFKPHYVPAYLLIVFAYRRWRSVIAAAGAAGAVVSSTLLAGGPPAIHALLANALAARGLVPISDMETWGGLIGAVLPRGVGGAVALVIFGAGLLGLFLAARRPGGASLRFAGVAGCLAILASPYSLPHDLIMLAVPVWIAFRIHAQARLPSPVAALLLTDAAVMADLHGTPVPLGAIALTVALVWYGVRRRGEAPIPHRHPRVA